MGDGVNIASRLEGVAAPGAICLSEDAYRQVKARLDLSVSDLGSTQLKNIAEPIRVYSLQVGSAGTKLAATSETATSQPATAAPPKLSIAVLPFANMSGDKDNEYFSDGLAEEIINILAQVPGLKVTARTSAFAFRGKEQDIRRIAEALNVRTVLEGSVRRSGNRIRVTAQLINADDGYHLWSERYDREMADVFALQDEIATAIAGALKLRLAAKPADARRHTPNLPAYEAFLKGRHYLLQAKPDALPLAREHLEQAIALDPQFADPHSELGQHYLVLAAVNLHPSEEMMPLARAEAQKALDLSPSEPRAHAVLGWVAAFFDYNGGAGQEHFRMAMAADPVPSEVRGRYCLYLMFLGRVYQAIEEMESVLEQDPLNILWRCALSSFLNRAEMYDRAIAEARKALELQEDHSLPHSMLAQCHASQGMFAVAQEFAEKAHRLAPWNSGAAGLLAAIYTRTGNEDRAKAMLARPVPGAMIVYHTVRSEFDAAADWFKKAIQQRETLGIFMGSGGLLRPLRQSRDGRTSRK
jgi:TolB-like protein/Tfp pilus assembly protein PilF